MKEKKNKEEIVEEKKDIEINKEVGEYRDKEVTMMDVLNRIFMCLIIIIVILTVNTVVLICKDGSSNNRSTSSSESDKNSEKEEKDDICFDGYDASMFNNVSLDETLKLFEGKGTYVLYVGRCNCGACLNYLPALQKAQTEYDFTVQYFDFLTLYDKDGNFKQDLSSKYQDFMSKLSYKYKMQENGEEKTKTFGEWFGYTPMTIIIKDGKQVDGEIGSIDDSTLSKMLEKNGIKKK